jgi:hypothetical protein
VWWSGVGDFLDLSGMILPINALTECVRCNPRPLTWGSEGGGELGPVRGRPSSVVYTGVY